MERKIAIALSASMFAAFCFVLFTETINAPSYDDYMATLNFIKSFYFEKSDAWSRFELMISRHNDHRIVLSRLLVLGYYSFFGSLNFSHLVLIQNIFLLGSFVLLYRLMLRYHVPAYAGLLVCAAFLFDLAFYQVSFYYWGGIQYYTVFFFSVLSLFYLNKAEKLGGADFWAAVGLVILAVFSFGNGFLALLLGGFILWAQKRYTLLAAWSLLTVFLLGVLFVSMEPSGATAKGPFNPEWMARLFFTFLGSFLYVNPQDLMFRYANIIFCALVGILIMSYWLWLFFAGYARRKPFLYVLLSLPILTALIISISRFDTKSAGGIAPRYMFFSAFIPIVLLLILKDQDLLKKSFLKAVVMGSVLVWGLSFYFNLGEFRSMNRDITQRIDQWQQDHATRLVYYSESEPNSKIRQWALDQHIIADHAD